MPVYANPTMPGPGWDWVKSTDTLQKGDEVWRQSFGQWAPTKDLGRKPTAGRVYRRKLAVATVAAKPNATAGGHDKSWQYDPDDPDGQIPHASPSVPKSRLDKIKAGLLPDPYSGAKEATPEQHQRIHNNERFIQVDDQYEPP